MCDFFSQEFHFSLIENKDSAANQNSYKICKSARDHVLAMPGKPLLASEEGPLFLEPMMKKVESKATLFIENNHFKSTKSFS